MRVGGLKFAERFNFTEMALARRETTARKNRARGCGKLVREQGNCG